MHSPVGGSVADIFVKCDAFVYMNSGLPPEEPTQDSRDGTASHEIGADIIKRAAVGISASWSDYAGKCAKDGTEFTDEMYECAKIYADDVINVMRSTGILGGESFRVEQLVTTPRVHPTAFSTPDMSIFHRLGSKLYLWDYKFGYSFVDAFENWQGVHGFAGLLSLYDINGLADQSLDLEFRIVQPRSYRKKGIIRKWNLKASDLRGYINQLSAAAYRQFEPNPTAKSGPHCVNCSARLVCPTALTAGMKLYEVAAKATPHEMTPMAIGLQLSILRRALKHLEKLESSYSEQVSTLIRRGNLVPGWTTEPKLGRDTWACGAENAIAIGKLYNVDIAKKGVLTPRQAIQAGLDEEIVKPLIEVPKRGVSVVQSTDHDVRRTFMNPNQ